jgi:hypothetical protein
VDGKGISQVQSLLHDPKTVVENGRCVLKGSIDARHMSMLERITGAEIRYLF